MTQRMDEGEPEIMHRGHISKIEFKDDDSVGNASDEFNDLQNFMQ